MKRDWLSVFFVWTLLLVTGWGCYSMHVFLESRQSDEIQEIEVTSTRKPYAGPCSHLKGRELRRQVYVDCLKKHVFRKDI